MTMRLGDVSIDCQSPQATRDFYAALTGWDCCQAYDCPALREPRGLLILFMACDFAYEPPVWPEEPGLQQKQMHLNLQTRQLAQAVKQALALCSQPRSMVELLL